MKITTDNKGVNERGKTMSEYFYKTIEIDNYAQLPLDFVKSAFYGDLNLGVKMLYALLLDRLGLSAKNKWVDNR